MRNPRKSFPGSTLWLAAAIALWPAAGPRALAQKPQEPPQQPLASAAEAERRARVLARFEGGQITVGEMEDAIAQKLPATRAAIATDAGRTRFLEDMIRYDVLALEAERRGFAKQDAVIGDAAKHAIDKMIGTAFPMDPAAVPAEDVQRDYQDQARKFNRPEQRRASHIVVATAADARSLLAELKGGDRQAFAKLARERSIDTTRTRGGDLGYFDRKGNPNSEHGTPVPEPLAAATFRLTREGEVSRKPVPLKNGFGIVMWTGTTPELRSSLAQVEERLREKRASDEQQRQVNALVERLRSEVAPEVHPELVDPIALDPVPPADIPSGFPPAPPDPRIPPVLIEPDEI
jgi:peptidyl-prolyl cis-trans isomerase C